MTAFFKFCNSRNVQGYTHTKNFVLFKFISKFSVTAVLLFVATQEL